ncbi:MAG: hypothetical protein AB7I29_13450 [Geobacter sp.]
MSLADKIIEKAKAERERRAEEERALQAATEARFASAVKPLPRPGYVVISDVSMPFWSMVMFMVKWSIAAIPALIILYFLVMFVFIASRTFL